MTAATLSVGLEDTGLQRRRMLMGTLLLAGGALGHRPARGTRRRTDQEPG